MSTTPLNTRVASSSARTTALTKLSSGRCEPSVETVRGKAEILEKRGSGEWVRRKGGNVGE